VWRIESAASSPPRTHRARRRRGEELAQDALLAHSNSAAAASRATRAPGSWARPSIAIDWLRRGKRLERKHEQIGRELDARGDPNAPDRTRHWTIRSAMTSAPLFMTCHPVLSSEARVALTLRLLGGSRRRDRARYLVAESTVAQRIVRAKRSLAEVRDSFELPRGDLARGSRRARGDLPDLQRGLLGDRGDDWMRPALCEEALRLAESCRALAAEPEVHGLVALMELQASRTRRASARRESPSSCSTRTARAGRMLIGRGSRRSRAETLRPPCRPICAASCDRRCHARAPIATATDWAES